MRRVSPLLGSMSCQYYFSVVNAAQIKEYYPSDDILVTHQDETLGYNSNWALKYDYRSKNPKWTYEHLYRDDAVDNSDRKKSSFFAETKIISETFRIRSKDYNDSGFDRGHLIPAGDFKMNQKSLNSTFTMANISPQNSSLNKGLWSQLESWLRSILLKNFDELIIISGPVFAPTFVDGKWLYIHNTIGTYPKLITIPTHFFKVVLAKKYVEVHKNIHQECLYLAAFLIPNAKIETRNDASLEPYLIKILHLESVVGFSFFEDLISENDKLKLDSHISDDRDLTKLLSADFYIKSSSISGNRSFFTVEQKSKSTGRIINHVCSDIKCSLRPIYNR